MGALSNLVKQAINLATCASEPGYSAVDVHTVIVDTLAGGVEHEAPFVKQASECRPAPPDADSPRPCRAASSSALREPATMLRTSPRPSLVASTARRAT